jgi:hypothetical protein
MTDCRAGKYQKGKLKKCKILIEINEIKYKTEIIEPLNGFKMD